MLRTQQRCPRWMKGAPARWLIALLACGCAAPLRPGAVQDPVTVYQLRPGDILNVAVFREPELSGTFRLTAEGMIRHPLLGDVTLAGMTVEAAETFLRERLSEKYLVNPRVILKIENSPALQVFVMGAVNKPGAVPIGLDEPLTLLDAIARAGGFTDKASPNRVHVVRAAEGRKTKIAVRVGDLLSGSSRERNLTLQPNDVVTVPEIWF